MKYKTDKKVIQEIKSKLFLSAGPDRKGQTIQKDGAQSHRPKLIVGLASLKILETANQESIWRLDCRSGVKRRVKGRNCQCEMQSSHFLNCVIIMTIYIAFIPPPLIKRMHLLENGLQETQGGNRWVTTLIS